MGHEIDERFADSCDLDEKEVPWIHILSLTKLLLGLRDEAQFSFSFGSKGLDFERINDHVVSPKLDHGPG